MLYTFLQAEVAAVAAQPQLEFSLIDMACKGGWLMIPLLLLSIATIYLFSMKWSTIRKASKVDPAFMQQIKEYIETGRISQAQELCRQTNTPTARLVEKGIERLGRPLQDIQTSIENVGNMEVAALEKGLPMLATIAGGAPMIGFLGTVMGMVQAFFNMAQAGSNIDITLLSGGIYTAMVTTVAGLIVGIMAYFGYNLLTNQVSDVVTKMQNTTVEFVDMLYGALKEN
ncbi:MAG: MotA/TolQ/ExbB proton channel family protein [Bacteroidales bacterium]|jgi:biopolymer transport protein ExbB|nr:MotA/TolQ/ExbB proton channel family protein [Bacteroidales bacterium]MBQ8645137.1 MotA/TolQ/ExbB proton channel family protein [Bacteroidales bacterium]